MDRKEIVRDYPMDVFSVLSGDNLADGEIVAIDSDGKAKRATDAASISVRGVAKCVRDGEVEIRNGIYCFSNSTAGTISRTDAGKAAFVIDQETVAISSTNSIAAGLVVDVTDEGVFVDMRLPSLAVASALAKIARNAADIEDLAELTSGTVGVGG